MNRLIFATLIAAAVACAPSKAQPAAEHSGHEAGHHAGHESGHDSMLMVQTVPATPVVGQPVALKMMIHDADGAMVREFEVEHEKLVHLIIVRDGLDEFAHVHPEVDKKGNLTITHTFPKAGKYRLFADHKAKGKSASVARATLEVSGDKAAPAKLVVNAPGKVTAEGVAAEIELKNAKAGKESEIRFQLSNEAGKPIEKLQPYLGARGHLVVISADGTQYVHAHPMDEQTAANEVVFMSHFPAAGTYKGWGQFRIAEKVRTVPFVVQIP